MTDEERIAKLERDLEFSAGPVVVVQTDLVRWLLGEYRRLKELKVFQDDWPSLRRDAARWRWCVANEVKLATMLYDPRGPMTEAVDAAREQVTTDWSGHQGGA